MDWNATGLTCDNPESDFVQAQLSTLPMTGCTDGWEYDYEGRQSFVTEVSGGGIKTSFGNNCVTIKNKMSNETRVLQFDLVCADSWYVDMFQATLSVGFLVGSIVIGYMADKYGRHLFFLSLFFFSP